MSERLSLSKFLSASSVALFMRALAACVAFLMNVFVTRMLGPHEAGLFFLGQTFLLLLAAVSRFGTDLLVVRLVSVACDRENAPGANGVVFNAGFVTMSLAAALALACYQASEWLAIRCFEEPAFAATLRAVAIGIVPLAMFQFLGFALQGRHQIAWSVAVGTAFFPALLLFGAQFGVALGVDNAAGMTAMAAAAAVVNALIGGFLWMKRAPLKIDFSIITLGALIASSIPMFQSALMILSNTWLPHLVLGAYAEPEQVAMLSNSHKTASLVGFILLAITSAAAPTYAAMYGRNDSEGLRQFVARVNGVVVVATAPLLFVMFAFSSQILSVFGEPFADAVWLLRVLVVGQFVNAATGGVAFLLVMSGHERSFRNATALSGIIGIVLAFVLIPRYEAMGAAITLTSVMALSNVFAAIQVNYHLKLNVLNPDFRFMYDYLLKLAKR